MPPSGPGEAGSGEKPEREFITAKELGLNLDLLPNSHAQAEERYEKWRSTDPFPDVVPALLNSADMFDYVVTTGMIHPFRLNPLRVDEALKPASCGISLAGECVNWTYDSDAQDGAPRKTMLQLDPTGVLELPPNSITYATLAPTFRLPSYIAARFNLSIGYVYRGLLVGTGPLVDPGFSGRLQIPLHNLTSSTCLIPASDAVLWMEFTKLSPNDDWDYVGERRPKSGRYVPFPERKLKERQTLDDYLVHANGGKPIISSIPESVETAERSAREAEKSAKSAADQAEAARERSEKFQVWTALGVGVAIIAAIIGLVTYINDVQTGVRSDANAALRRTNELERELNQIRDRWDGVKSGAPRPVE